MRFKSAHTKKIKGVPKMGIKMEGLLTSVKNIRNGVSEKSKKEWRMAVVKVLVVKEDGSDSNEYEVNLTNDFTDDQFIALRKLIMSPVAVDVDSITTYRDNINFAGFLNIKNQAATTNNKPAASNA